SGIPAEELRIQSIIDDIVDIKDKEWKDLNEGELEAARLALVYAEDWLKSFIESWNGHKKEVLWDTRLLKNINKRRLELFGKTAFEVFVERSKEYRLQADREFRDKDGNLMPTRKLE